MNRLEQIQARLRELADGFTYLEAFDTLDTDQRALFDAAVTEADTLINEQTDLKNRQAQLDRVRTAAANPTNVERGEFNAPNVHRTTDNDDLYRLDGREYVDMPARRLESEMFGRAEKVIDAWDDGLVTDEHREAARIAIQRGQTRKDRIEIAAQIVRMSNPNYLSAFEKVLSNPMTAQYSMTEGERAAMAEATTTAGGFMVPPMLDPSIILTNNGTTNPFRSIATIKTIATQTWKGVTSAGVTAEWTAEAAEAADASPTVAQPTITPVRADAYIQASFEMLQDTGIGNEVAMLLGDAKDRLESAGFAVGTGSTQPWGIVTRLGATTASRVAGSSGAAGAADLVVADIYALDNAMAPRHRANATWLGEKTTYNRIRQFATGSGPQHAFWTDLGGGRPPQLIGYDVYESSEMDNTIVSGSNDDILILGDFKKYYVVDRIGMSVAFDPLVKGTNQRPNGQAGWFAFWRVGGDAVDANAFRMLRV